MTVSDFHPARVSQRTTSGSPQSKTLGKSQQTLLKHPDAASVVVDHLVGHPGCNYSKIYQAIPFELRSDLGHSLNELIGQSIVWRTKDGRYSLPLLSTGPSSVTSQIAEDKFLTTAEAAHIARIHPVTLLRWAREGRVPHRRLSARKIVFSQLQLTSWIQGNYTIPVGHAASTHESEAA